MFCVLSLFGEVDLQQTLQKAFGQKDIFFIEGNCTTSVQLTAQVEAHCKEVDAVIVYANAINMDIKDYVSELRSFVENLRIILVLNGNSSLFLHSQLNEYRELGLDLVFDDNGFDAEELISFIIKGKLSARNKKDGIIEDKLINERKKPFSMHREKPLRKKEQHLASETSDGKPPTPISFSEPQGHFTIGVLNAARGAGATWTANNLARYFAMQNYKTCIVDMSLSGAVGMMKLKNVDTYTKNFDIEELKSKYNVTVIDFGTPIEVSPRGDNFKLMEQYKPETIQCFTNCDVKLIMGFSAPWNIEKIKFFFINDTWCSLFDDSYLFIIEGKPDRVKKLFPDGNFYSREDDYREHILDAFRKEEYK